MPTITISTPEKFIIAENGIAQSKPQPSTSGINKLLEANTHLAVWLVFLAFGGGILALYYARIGYLPEMEWKAALVYLFVGSIVGGTITVLLTIAVFIPGFLWSEFILFEPGLDFSYPVSSKGVTREERGPDLCIRSIITYLGLPFFGALLLSHLALPIGRVSYWLFAAAILAVTFFLMRRVFEGLLSTDESLDTSAQVFKCAFWFTLSVFLSQISMGVIYWLSGRPGALALVHDGPGGLSWDGWSQTELRVFIVLTVMCTTGVLVSNHVVAAVYRYHPRHAIVAALVIAVLLLFTADRFSSLSVRLMSSYGFGGGSNVTLLMTENGAKIVNGLGLSPSPQTVKLENVEVLSKIGEHYFFNLNGKTFTLAKSDVLSMESDDRRRKK
jgi:hypothetical protein